MLAVQMSRRTAFSLIAEAKTLNMGGIWRRGYGEGLLDGLKQVLAPFWVLLALLGLGGELLTQTVEQKEHFGKLLNAVTMSTFEETKAENSEEVHYHDRGHRS